MDLPINATIECADGECGNSTAIILNPVTHEISDLIVREPGLLGIERMVSIEFVTESAPEWIRLRCSKEELANMPPFVTTSYLSASTDFWPGYGTGMLYWPYLRTPRDVGIDQENTPSDELALRQGAHVHATDGHIGEVEEFLVSPENNRITHVVLREGHFWNRQDVTIPVAQIDHIDDDTVYLKLTKDEIEALPAIAVH